MCIKQLLLFYAQLIANWLILIPLILTAPLFKKSAGKIMLIWTYLYIKVMVIFFNHVLLQTQFDQFLWFLAFLIKNDQTFQKMVLLYFLVGIKMYEISAYI